MNAGTAPMRPVSGIRTASSASEGMVCTTPVAPRISAFGGGALGGENAERNADERCSPRATGTPASSARASGARSRDRRACARGRRVRVALAWLADRASAFDGGAAPAATLRFDRNSAATVAKSLPVELGRRVHAPHRRRRRSLPSSRCSAAQVLGSRCGRSAR